jgi:ABC-2 type transport system permease protein
VSFSHRVRAFRALARVGATEAVAYRTEVVVWLLSTTMPLVMIAFYTAVARDGPLGRWGGSEIVAYFLATFIVRSLTGSFVSRQMNLEVRDGTLTARLLRPVHPLLAYAAEGVGALPIRVAVAVPVAIGMLAGLGPSAFAREPAALLAFAASLLGAWLLSLLVSFAVGALSFFIDWSDKVMDAWLAGLFVFSGYTIPIDLFPERLRAVVDWLPFRYQIGLPVELLIGVHPPREALALLGRQWIMVAAAAWTVRALWRRGVGRFAAYGG